VTDLIHRILPAPRIHLLGGNSNAGKTRFIIPTMLEWQKGEPILGFKSHPVPWAYVVGDRLLAEAEATMEDMGIDPASITKIPAFGPDNKNASQIMREAARLKVGLIVWEGFSDFNPGRDHRRDVREYLSTISAACYANEFHKGGLTIIGIMESPKLKPAERYQDPRQRISGVASWGYHSSTVMLIEATDPKDLSNTARKLYVSVKNGISFECDGGFNLATGQLSFDPPG
jgi:AAA domain